MSKKQSINNNLETCRICIWNASDDPVISTRIAPFGFDEAKLTGLKNLYNETLVLVGNSQTENAEWREACETFSSAYELSIANFRKIRQSLKFWYDADSSEAIALNLYTKKVIRYTDFLQTAKNFYTKVIELNAVVEKLLPFNYTAEILNQLRSDLDQLDVLKADREKESGDAQYSTKARNAKIDELMEESNEIKALAKLIFLDEEAQYLEKLGIISRS